MKPATELLRLLRDGTISAVELVQAHLGEVERLNGTLGAFVHVDVVGSLAAAHAADRARQEGRELPLLGLPISIKSSIEVAGLRCETGALMHQGFVPKQDAVAVTRLKSAGAIVLGTTNCPEFLMAYETDNLMYGKTANPWNIEYTAGGSSGGEAAAIAAGLSAGGLGSDSGGSVREPAHFNGICALKPTSGRIPSEGHTLPCVGPFSILGSLGPMARTMEDVTLLFNVLGAGARKKRARVLSREELRSRPVGVLEDDGLAPVAADIRHAVRVAAEALEWEGFIVRPFKTSLLEAARRLWWTFFMRCGRLLLEPMLEKWDGPLSSTFQYYLDTVRSEPMLGAGELLAAWGAADGVRAGLEQELAKFSAVLTPVCSIPAFQHGERRWTVEGRSLEYFEAMRFTQWFNLLGSPAAVVPVSLTAVGLPAGVQVAGSSHEDEAVLGVAAILDRHFGYQAPPMARAGHLSRRSA